jgi:O-antigen/teichoic acid export membrane protein
MVPTWLLLVASCVSVPGLIAGAGLDSAGRPGLRSASLGLALIVNIVGLLLLVPPLGAVGGALAALLSTAISTVFLTVAASRILHLRGHEFFWTRRTDLDLLRSAVLALAGRAGVVRRPRDRV